MPPVTNVWCSKAFLTSLVLMDLAEVIAAASSRPVHQPSLPSLISLVVMPAAFIAAMYALVSSIPGCVAELGETAVRKLVGEPMRYTFCIALGPPVAWTKLEVAQPEHSLIGIVGFCALTDLMNVIVSGPGVRPSTMICGFAASSF